MKHVIMMNEEIVKKRPDFRLGMEGWSTGFEVAECETKWCDTSSHGKKVFLYLCNGNHCDSQSVFSNQFSSKQYCSLSIFHAHKFSRNKYSW